MKPKDLKEAIRRARADRRRQLEEQEALRAMTTSTQEEGEESDENASELSENPSENPCARTDFELEADNGEQITDGCSRWGARASAEAAGGEIIGCGRREGYGGILGQDMQVDRPTREGEGGGRDILASCKRRRNQQPAQFNGRAICAYEMTTQGVEPENGGKGGNQDGPGGTGGGGGVAVASRQLKEMSFLQDLAATEAEERDRSFKVRSQGSTPGAIEMNRGELGGAARGARAGGGRGGRRESTINVLRTS